MRETPSQTHLEAWCIELTLGGVITEEGPEDLLRRAELLDRESRRLLRIATKTPTTKATRRSGRYLKAAGAKARAVYVGQIAQRLRSEPGLEVAGDLDYATAHMTRATANAFGENWLARQVAW